MLILGLLFCQNNVEAFYSTVKGTWLNRDVVEEKGGKNLYGFVSNQTTIMYDDLGLLECPLQEEEVDVSVLNPNPTPEWRTYGDTQVSFVPHPSQPTACSCGWKYSYSATCQAKIRYISPKNITKKLKIFTSDNTVEQHEMTHYRNYVSVYSDVYNEWMSAAGKCMTSKCYSATLAYLQAYSAAMHAYASYINESFDANEYVAGPEKDKKDREAASSLIDYEDKKTIWEQLLIDAFTACAYK